MCDPGKQSGLRLVKLFVPKEPPGERRVAISADALKRLQGLGVTALVESGAGEGAGMPDALLAEAGAEIVQDAAAARGQADILVAVRPPAPEALHGAKAGAVFM